MAEVLDKNLKVELGQLIRVNNLNKKSNENALYVALQVEDENGCNERCILFTEIQLSDMEKIKAEFLNNLVFGRIYRFEFNKKETNVIKVKNYDGKIKFLRVSDSQLLRAQKRAQRNQQDLTKKSFLTNMFD